MGRRVFLGVLRAEACKRGSERVQEPLQGLRLRSWTVFWKEGFSFWRARMGASKRGCPLGDIIRQ